MYKRLFKRFFDLIGSFCLILILSPVFVLLILILTLSFLGNPFFIQARPGRNEKEFRIVKFRSMKGEYDNEGNSLTDNQRITKTGAFIRKWSMDELPQLFNVFIGDMSFVGPRPLLFKYIPLYSTEQKRRHNVRPGITGWAQVNGRNAISWRKKFELDVYYVDNVSFFLDLKICWMTLFKVMMRKNINQTLDRPMQPFDGSN